MATDTSYSGRPVLQGERCIDCGSDGDIGVYIRLGDVDGEGELIIRCHGTDECDARIRAASRETEDSPSTSSPSSREKKEAPVTVAAVTGAKCNPETPVQEDAEMPKKSTQPTEGETTQPTETAPEAPAPSEGADSAPLALPAYPAEVIEMFARVRYWTLPGSKITESDALQIGKRARKWGIALWMDGIALGRKYRDAVDSGTLKNTDVFSKQVSGYSERRIKDFRAIADALDGCLPMLEPGSLKPIEGEFLDLDNEKIEVDGDLVGLPPVKWVAEQWGIDDIVTFIRNARRKTIDAHFTEVEGGTDPNPIGEVEKAKIEAEAHIGEARKRVEDTRKKWKEPLTTLRPSVSEDTAIDPELADEVLPDLADLVVEIARRTRSKASEIGKLIEALQAAQAEATSREAVSPTAEEDLARVEGEPTPKADAIDEFIEDTEEPKASEGKAKAPRKSPKGKAPKGEASKAQAAGGAL